MHLLVNTDDRRADPTRAPDVALIQATADEVQRRMHADSVRLSTSLGLQMRGALRRELADPRQDVG